MAVNFGKAMFLAATFASVHAMDNSLARTPPMGWSSWNCFGGAQSQDKMETVAQAIVTTGLRDLGYVNLAVDGGWRNFQKGGPPVPGTGYVGPAGWNFTQLAATYHAMGLKLGMYVTGGFEAVFGHEDAWAKVMFGEWGTDGVKVDHMCQGDNCGNGTQGHMMAVPYQRPCIERWAAAIAAINLTNRVLFQNCGVGCAPSSGDGIGAQPWGDWCPQTANMWRTGGDAAAMWGPLVGLFENLGGRGHLAGPGGWNYPDSLEIGNKHRGVGLTPAQARAHFSLYCVTSSPLILGNDVRNMSADDFAIVSNRDAIRVNQAWAGFAGDMLNYSQHPPVNPSKSNVTQVPALSVWWKPLPNRSAAAVLFNRAGSAATISFRFEELQWQGARALASAKNCIVRDVWAGADVGIFSGGFSAAVNGSSVFFAIVSGCTP